MCCCLLSGGCYLLSVVRCLLPVMFVVYCLWYLLSVVCWLLSVVFVVCCLLSVVCDVCFLLSVVWCLVSVVCDVCVLCDIDLVCMLVCMFIYNYALDCYWMCCLFFMFVDVCSKSALLWVLISWLLL